MPTQTRQLAAIMFTDIVGYTALMGKDSNKALELVRINKEIQKPLVGKHNGKWVKEMGDGTMAQFGSALDAVNCALEIQEFARAKFDGKLRIGIHLGDITIENNDVYGDGVNVAARLESIADPGGIYISESIEKAIRGQSGNQAKYLGEIQLKNVDYGVRTYALQGVGLPAPDLKKDKELPGRFLAEIKRRGVIRAGIMYILISLLLVLLQPFVSTWITFPDAFRTILFTVLGVGFPIAVYLAWRYERSPEGIVPSSSKQSWQNPLNAGQRKPLTGNFIIVGLILLIIVIYAYPQHKPSKSEIEDIQNHDAIKDKSIAILPFVDKSPEGDQEWYSDGIMEEVRNYLVQVQNLKISSGTVTMEFKDSDKSFKEIGEELGVSYILTGSVMRLENNIKINIQLTDVKSGQYQWTESYDQQLTSVFSILSEVAQKVASTLDAQIQSQLIERMEQLPTENMEAYDLYLKAASTTNLVSIDNQVRIELLNQAIELDSNFAEAYALLGNSILFQAGFVQGKNPSDVEGAKSLLEKALLLDPLNGFVHNRMASYSLWYEKDFKKAEIHCLTGIGLAPSNLSSYNTYIDLLLSTGRFHEAIPIGAKLLELFGNYPSNHGKNALLWAFNNEEEKMNENIRQAKQAPDDILAITESARAYLIQKQYDQVLEVLDLPDTVLQEISRVKGLKSIAYYKMGDIENHNIELNALIQKSTDTAGQSPSFYTAMIYSSKNNVDEAFRWLEKSFQDNEIELYWLKVEPEFESLYNDPRWQEMLDKVGFPE